MKLPRIIDERYENDHGFWWGRWWFFPRVASGLDYKQWEAFQLPEGFTAFATDMKDAVLALYDEEPRIVYLMRRGKGAEEIEVFAETEELFRAKLERDELWERISERMAAEKRFLLDVIFHTAESGRLLTLHFTDPQDSREREHVFQFRGSVEPGETMVDALERELTATFAIDSFEAEDVLDKDLFVETAAGELVPIFEVHVRVERGEMEGLETGEASLVWVEEGN